MPMQCHLDISFSYKKAHRHALMMIIMLVCIGLGLGNTSAEPFSQFIVFGDGFSDQGNVFLATNGLVPASPPNLDGRLSNGPVWVERLAERLMLTLTPVQMGGTNYAYIGAKVNADVTLPQALGALTIPRIVSPIPPPGEPPLPGMSQVEMFLATIPPDDSENEIDNDADPQALYIVSGGANDLFEMAAAMAPVENVTPVVSGILLAVNELGSEGALYFLVPNLPDLGRSPRGMMLDTAAQALLTSYTTAFNDLLETGLSRLEIDLGIIAFRMDMAQTINAIFDNPSASGFTNVTDPCLTGESLSGGTPCTDPDVHLFWDSFRPTASGHAAIAGAALTGQVRVAGASIQASVDIAQPGDTIVVPPGSYSGMVLITQSDLTIHASRQAVLDASGQPNGLKVGIGEIAPDAQGRPQCPQMAVGNFTLRGLAVQNAEARGISLIGVDTLRVVGGDYIGNGEYGIHVSCSRDGLIHLNRISDHRQSAILIDNSTESVVRDNRLTENAIGVEVENAANITIIQQFGQFFRGVAA